MKNYYETLGVERNASPEDIKRAYRQKASLYHPDKEGGSKTKFQEVEEAYRTLSDPNKRAQYDNPSPFGQGFGGFQQNNPFDFDNIFSVFGARFNHPQAIRRAQMSLWITLLDSAQGGHKAVSVGSRHGNMTVDIEIPKGINDGESVQYPNIGPEGMDLVVTFRIHPNPKFTKHGSNLIMDQAVTIWDLILGVDLEIRDLLNNALILSIPPRTQPGAMMRLRGRGMPQYNGPTGDLIVRIQAEIPQKIDQSILDAIEKNKST